MAKTDLRRGRGGGLMAFAARVWPWALALGLALCVWMLEARFQGLKVSEVTIDDTPVTLYAPDRPGPHPPVIVAHGFAGSRQMMDQIAVSVARQGFAVAALDLQGHGRNPDKLSPDITRIEGTTAQLAAQVTRVTDALLQRPDLEGPVSFVGHSMATDIVVRAAQNRDDVAAVVALSMYSPAVTPSHPQRLLVINGMSEGHLRAASLETARQIAPGAAEGETVTNGAVTRRIAVAPYVGHVGVLYAPTTLRELTDWIREGAGQGTPAPLDLNGWVPALLLAGLVLLAWPVAARVPKKPHPRQAISNRTFLACLLIPIPFALVAAALPSFGIAGHAAFGTLALILGLWGIAQLFMLTRAGVRFARPDPLGTAVYLALGLIFALALDRYGASFVPTGPRWIILAGLLLGALPVMLADSTLARHLALWRRIVMRLALLMSLGAAMALSPTELGLSFTVLPVLALFFLVYGTIGQRIATRRGPEAVALGKAVALAWAIAASTPLFASGLAG